MSLVLMAFGIRRALLYTVNAMSFKTASSLFGLWSLNKVSTVTICKTSLGILKPESITTLDADDSSTEALQFRALAT
ncbi:Os05g0447540 [Oryza sativa Japonica Group]|uniref:Os05g0447540 protein n=1 Tax=Oryza sativa subsp. japonica TaxID=39947 RepID=A0A0N7KKV8_ORYSJ|nr:hypothetical protein EE612_029844 [Oryza sativa]BAS94297.1 Os05g0447540 [Oryza sativa Japonica Group]